MENINNFVYRDKTNTAIKMYTGIFFVLSLFLKNYTSCIMISLPNILGPFWPVELSVYSDCFALNLMLTIA